MIETIHAGGSWEVIVEPWAAESILVVITAYPIDKEPAQMMKHPFLEVTYRQGKPLAAYLYPARQSGDASSRTVPFESGLMIDYAADGRAIGIEITSPTRVSLESINPALAVAKHEAVTAMDLFPLPAA